MRWLSFEHRGNQSFGYAAGDQVVDVGSFTQTIDLRTYLEQREAHNLVNEELPNAVCYSSDSISFLPPITNPRKILCVGLNYHDHQRETGRGGEAYPTIFTRFSNVQIGHRENLLIPKESHTLDFEGEIALVIGKRGRRISSEHFQKHVFGLSCYNDATVREFQRHTSQFTPGKNFMGTGAFGPWISTLDEFEDLSTIELSTRLNGETMQSAISQDMVFGFGELVSYCSTFVELEPGDIIVTGTPGGVGSARTPPRYLKEGDTVEVSVSQVGTLSNQVIQG